MYKNRVVSVVVPAYNEETQISRVIETMPENTVDWTNPEGDIFWDIANPFGNLGIPADGFIALMLDSSVHTIHPSLAPSRFKALVTWGGREIIDWSLW